jgi:hypothetical protein
MLGCSCCISDDSAISELAGYADRSGAVLGYPYRRRRGDYWNTLGGDHSWDLWLALNPDGSSPINGPSDSQAAISVPLEAARAYTFYMFGASNGLFNFGGLNLFFEGDNSTPGISVFGPVNSLAFAPNASSTYTLAVTPVNGASTVTHSAAGVVVALTEYNWNTPATPPGNVCQPYSFTQGAQGCFFGSFSLRVFPAADLALSQGSGSPFTTITTTGSGFAPNENIDLYAGPILLATATTNASGSFVVPAREPQHSVGPMDVYAYGLTSGKLGAATLFVTSSVATYPAIAAPGGAVTAYPLGFGASETVSIYWNEPRQLLGTTTANQLGSGAFAITVPANAAPGLNGVYGVGGTTGSLGLGRVWVK